MIAQIRSFPLTMLSVTRRGNVTRLAGVASDTSVDAYGTRMGLPLLKGFVRQFQAGARPYLSPCHYRVSIGPVDQLDLRGNMLTLEGSLDPDNPAACELAERLKDDVFRHELGFSIGFDPLASEHDSEGHEVFTDGALVHVAVTGRPANPRTWLEVRSTLSKRDPVLSQSQREDATALFGPVFAALLENQERYS